MNIQLYFGDCMKVLPELEAKSINAIITDLPYGRTNCEWDEVIPFGFVWEQADRLLKPKGVFVTTAAQPFTSRLVISNLPWFKYAWVWNKGKGVGFTLANCRPMMATEDVVVFSRESHNYYPQMVVRGGRQIRKSTGKTKASEIYRLKPWKKTYTGAFYPKNIIEIGNSNNSGKLHPTQKPVRLYEYLILTYTNEGETVLDFTMGSGTTGVACVQTNRNFIGVEIEEKYFKIAKDRIDHMNQLINRKD